jgi:type IV secretory pathway VirB2 component (pilin)
MTRFVLGLCMAFTLLVGGTAALPPLAVPSAHAQVFNGPGLEGGVNAASQVNGPVNKPLREFVTDLLAKVLNFLALAAVIVVIIAGLYLIFSNGSDDAKNKAKNIILYTIIGLLVILFARTIVGIVVSIFK